MRSILLYKYLAGLGTVFLLAACDGGASAAHNGVRQTGFPGQISAGGGTSGEVMARSSQPATGSQEGMRGQAAGGSIAGTPSIPEGSGGTTSGAAMGGTTTGAAASQGAPAPSGGAPAVPPRNDKK